MNKSEINEIQKVAESTLNLLCDYPKFIGMGALSKYFIKRYGFEEGLQRAVKQNKVIWYKYNSK